jgi:hypothetical protein
MASLLLLLAAAPTAAAVATVLGAPAPPPALPTGAVYLQVQEGGTRKDLKGNWLSFSGLDMKFYAPTDLDGRAPFLLVPSAGTPGGFSLQNLWRGYKESRYGDLVSLGAGSSLVLVPEADAAAAAVFTAVPAPEAEASDSGGSPVYLDCVRAGKPDATKGWVGALKAADGVQLVATAERVSWSFVAAPDAMLPPSGPPVFFQVASGAHKNDWVGFGGTTVCCGACAKTEDERGIWGLIPAASNATTATPSSDMTTAAAGGKVYHIMNLWRAPSEPRVGDWLGVVGSAVVLSPKTEPLTERIAWRAVPAAAAAAAAAAAPDDSTVATADGGAFYLQDVASESYIGLSASEAVTMVPPPPPAAAPTTAGAAESRVAFAFVVAPKPPPPPPAPPPPCGYNNFPPCVCPHPPSGGSSSSPPPPCSAPTPSPCLPSDSCEPGDFLGLDKQTQGAYKEAGYGSAGQYFPGMSPTSSSQKLPPYVASIAITAVAAAASAVEEGIEAGGDGGAAGLRRNAWPALSTATDPRALAADGPHVYRSLSFVATVCHINVRSSQ